MKMAESAFTNIELKAEPFLPRAEHQLGNSKTETAEDSGIDRNVNGNRNTSSAESNSGRARRILLKFLFGSYM